jgi:hypothetical protein
MPQIIQFLHPGSEHNLNTGLQWNRGNHHRKFMQGFGEYISPNGKSDINYIEFWGELEPNSRIFGEVRNVGNGLPSSYMDGYCRTGKKSGTFYDGSNGYACKKCIINSTSSPIY